MSKVYCGECTYYIQEECRSPDNVRQIDTPIKVLTVFHYLPETKNTNNNCSWFKIMNVACVNPPTDGSGVPKKPVGPPVRRIKEVENPDKKITYKGRTHGINVKK